MFKKALAGMLATTMVLGMSMTALAATGSETGSGSTTGSGDFEGHVDKEIIAVTFPTDSTSVFNYKMDPEGLIATTDGAKHSGATFEPGANVYFQSAENTWTSESKKLEVVNKGTVSVDVTILAQTDENNDVAMAASDTFTGNNAELYLGLKVADQAEVAVDTTDTAGKVTVGLKGNDANFEITTTDSGYAYEEKSGVPDTAWNSFAFGLRGKCNPNGDYSKTGLTASGVTVTWSYEVRSDETNPMAPENAVADAAPSVEEKTYIMTSGQDVLVDISLGAGNKAATGVASVSYVVSGKTYTFASGEFSVEDDNLILSHSKTDVFVNSGVKNREVTIQFNDEAKTKGKVILTTAD